MNDNFRHQGLRLKLVELLRNKGIANDKVLMAISKIPRHLFLDKAFLDFAYQDKLLLLHQYLQTYLHIVVPQVFYL